MKAKIEKSLARGKSTMERARQELTAKTGKATVEKRSSDSMDGVGVASDLGGDEECESVLRGRLWKEQRKLEKQTERGGKGIKRRRRRDCRSGRRCVYGDGRNVQTKSRRKGEIDRSGCEGEEQWTGNELVRRCLCGFDRGIESGTHHKVAGEAHAPRK